jgi:hypothetical protein
VFISAMKAESTKQAHHLAHAAAHPARPSKPAHRHAGHKPRHDGGAKKSEGGAAAAPTGKVLFRGGPKRRR